MAELQPGLIIKDTYRIEEKIGEGGLAVVYRGTDLLMQTPVAIKHLKKNIHINSEHFLREARIQSQLVHQNIVGIRVILESDGEYFIIMELIEGGTLADLIRASTTFPRLPLHDIAKIFTGLLQGLGYAHEKGTIHRDIKPSNILILPDKTAKIADFGLAFAQNTKRLTRTGAIRGTPAYMSKEQLGGKKDLDARSDIYSVGVSLYEAIMGRTPFLAQGETLTPIELIGRQLFMEPFPMQEGDCTISPALQKVIFKSLKKDPEERFTSCEEFLQALRQALPQDPLWLNSFQQPDDDDNSTFPEDDENILPSGFLEAPHQKELFVASSPQKRTFVREFSQDKIPTKRPRPTRKWTKDEKDLPKRKKSSWTRWGLLFAFLFIGLGVLSLRFPEVSNKMLDKILGIKNSQKKTNLAIKQRKNPIKRPFHARRKKLADIVEIPLSFMPSLHDAGVAIEEEVTGILNKKLKKAFPPLLSSKPAIKSVEDKNYPRRLQGSQMRAIPRGYFWLGNGTTEPRLYTPKRRIYLDDFWIDQFEVTVQQYAACHRAHVCRLHPKMRFAEQLRHPQRPVVGVTWQEASEFCRWLHKTLPTEAQWEKAARGTDERPYPWGYEKLSCQRANFAQCGSLLKEVGLRKRLAGRSPFGVYDMAGNVWEWTQDCFDARPHPYRFLKKRNPLNHRGNCSIRMLRGGSWSDRARWKFKTYARRGGFIHLRRDNIGFRCAWSFKKSR